MRPERRCSEQRVVVWVWTAAAACATAGAHRLLRAGSFAGAECTSTATDANNRLRPPRLRWFRRGKLHGVAKSGNIPLPRNGDSAEHADRQALYDDNGYHRGVVADDSAEWALRDSDTICGLCGGLAGSAFECHKTTTRCLSFNLILASAG